MNNALMAVISLDTDVEKEHIDILDVVKAYISLAFVERVFRNLKTVQLEIRPVYHKNDDRIRSHLFLYMLAYYLQWHIKQRLAPLIKANGVGEAAMLDISRDYRLPGPDHSQHG